MSHTAVLLAVRHKESIGELTGDQGVRLLIAYRAIENRLAAQIAYEDHLRDIAYKALTDIGYETAHYDLDGVKADILNALDVPLLRV